MSFFDLLIIAGLVYLAYKAYSYFKNTYEKEAGKKQPTHLCKDCEQQIIPSDNTCPSCKSDRLLDMRTEEGKKTMKLLAFFGSMRVRGPEDQELKHAENPTHFCLPCGLAVETNTGDCPICGSDRLNELKTEEARKAAKKL